MARAKSGKPYHHGELREALVEAGRKLLEEKGLRGFTLRECARRAEVSHAAPAHHFASIDDLLAEIATRGYHELTEAMAAEARRSNGDAAARLVGQGVGYMAFAAANPVLFQLMFSREANRFETPALADRRQVGLPPAPRSGRSGDPAGVGRGEGAHGRLRLGRRARLHHPGPRRPARRAGFVRVRSRRAGSRPCRHGRGRRAGGRRCR